MPERVLVPGRASPGPRGSGSGRAPGGQWETLICSADHRCYGQASSKRPPRFQQGLAGLRALGREERGLSWTSALASESRVSQTVEGSRCAWPQDQGFVSLG